MKRTAPRTFRFLMLMLAATLSLSSVGCRKKKLLAEEKARQEQLAAQKKNKAIQRLEEMIASVCQGFDHLDRLERELEDIKAQNIDDAEVMVLIRKAEYHLQQERERLERERAAAEAATTAEEASMAVGPRVNQIFGEITRAGNTAIANAKIEELIGMFSSDRVPVLIVISDIGGTVDYDRPTTIRKFLNYLKDTGNNNHQVRNVVLDANGKIKELELIKQ